MDRLSKELSVLENAFGVTILIARITGRRWAFSGFSSSKVIPTSPSRKIVLGQNSGVIVYGWYDLDNFRQEELEKKISELGVEHQ